MAAAGVCQAVHLRMSYVQPVEPEGRRSGYAGQGLGGPPLRLLFVGDSVCMGIGAKIAAPLQKACADRLAALRGRPVAWRTVGAAGADVRELCAMFQQREEHDADQPGCRGAFDIAVVLCGVNDGKKFLQGRLPSAFGEDLAKLCSALRQAAPEGSIAVPCIPALTEAPLLQLWPLRHLVDHFFQQFEAQKEAVAAADSLHCPTPPANTLPRPTDTRLWASDGIHPSGEGYAVIGEWLGSALACV